MSSLIQEITSEERSEPNGLMPQPQPQQNMQPMYVPQVNNANNNQRQVPVRLSSVNFEGVFTSSRLNMENLISQNLYSNTNNQQQTSANVIPPQSQPPKPANQVNIGLGSKGTPQQGSQPRK